MRSRHEPAREFPRRLGLALGLEIEDEFPQRPGLVRLVDGDGEGVEKEALLDLSGKLQRPVVGEGGNGQADARFGLTVPSAG